MTLAWQLLLNGLVAGALYSLVAIGFALIFGATHHFHIAHAAVIETAAYMAYAFNKTMGLPLVLSLCGAVLVAVLLSVFLLCFVYTPLEQARGTSRLGIFLASLGCLIVVENGFTLWFGPDNVQADFAQSWKKPIQIGSGSLTVMQMGLIVAAVVFYVAIRVILRRTRLGQEIRALATNPELVQILGRSPMRIKISVYVLASTIAAAAGIYQVSDTGITPGITTELFIFAFVAVIAGSVGSIGGAFAMAFMLGLLQNVLQIKLAAQWTTPVVFLLFLLLILLRPEGIAVRRTRHAKTPADATAGQAELASSANTPTQAGDRR